jgi:hypothetical protein
VSAGSVLVGIQEDFSDRAVIEPTDAGQMPDAVVLEATTSWPRRFGNRSRSTVALPFDEWIGI